MNFSWFALYCGFMLSISAFSIDILLPALLAISAGLNAPIESVQLTIPVYMLALGLANPMYGVLSDRVGRKTGIFVGLGIYMVGAGVCAGATGIGPLLVGRFLQGFGAACAPVICRAMIRDKFQGVQLAQTMAIASMFFALGPMLAPLLGYVLFATAGWRAVFVLLIVLSLCMLIATLFQEESLPSQGRRERGFASIWLDVSAVIRHPLSRMTIALACVSTSIILTFLAHAPIVYANLGASPGMFSIMFACTAFGIVPGQLINHRLLSIIAPIQVALYAAMVVAGTAAIVWMASVTDTLNIYLLTGLMFLFNTSYLLIFSNLVSMTLDPHGQRAGMASAMFGFFSYIGGSLITVVVAFLTNEQTNRWAFCFMAISVLLLVGLGSVAKKFQFQ